MHTAHILLVEDDPNQVNLVRMALGNVKRHFTIDDVGDGIEALAYLRREGQYSHRPRPDVVILDLNMPRLGGHETLAIIKNDSRLRTIPVVILTTSANQKDRERACDNHANSYVVKPQDFDDYELMIQSLEFYWGHLNTSVR